MGIQGVILDVDGTLVLSNDAHAQAWVEAFAKFGYKVEFDQIRPLIGMGGDHIIPKFVPELSSKEGQGKEISAYRQELIVNKFGPNLAAAPGAHQLISKLQDEGLQTVIASSAKTEELKVLLKAAQVDDLLSLNQAATSSEAEVSKPAPDIVEVTLNKFNLQPRSVVMLGDTPYDIESATKAGVGVIALRCGGFNDTQLQGAIAIYDDPADLLTHYDSSPLAHKVDG